MLFCNPWSSVSQQQQDRELPFDQEHFPNTSSTEAEHGELSEFQVNSSAREAFETPVKKTEAKTSTDDNSSSSNNSNPIIMLFFGQRNPQHGDKEEKDDAAATPATVGMEDEEDEQVTPLSASYPSSSVPASAESAEQEVQQPEPPQQQQTPMIRMKNFFATPFVPRGEDSTLPSAKETGDSAASSLEDAGAVASIQNNNIESTESSEENWVPLHEPTSLTQSISRALNFDALLSVRNNEESLEAIEVEKDVVELDDLSSTRSSSSSSASSSPIMKFTVMAVVLVLLAMSANNTLQSVQERRAIFRSTAHAHAAEVVHESNVVQHPVEQQPSKPVTAPETATASQDSVDSSTTKAEARVKTTAPTQESSTATTSLDLSSLFFWKSNKEPKAQFFPWVDEGLQHAKEKAIKTLKETHKKLLEFADFLQAHKEERAFQRLCYRDALQEKRQQQADSKWWSKW